MGFVMNQEKVFNILKKPSIYGSNVKRVDVIQTHISYVFLTGKYVYKIKKPVNFGFLDFSTLEKRKYFCEEELKLNRRLCPQIYLDVVSITKKNDDLELNGSGEVIEYALKMKEFPQEKIISNLIKKDKVDKKIIEKICDVLVDFYKKSERSKEIDTFGTVKIIKKNTDENFEQTESVIGVTISQDVFDFIKDKTNAFLNDKKDVFDKRISDGFICDCHGDLHTGNIVILDEKVCIFDCIEFNKRFRYSDVASDIAFLAMDLEYQGYSDLSNYLVEKYVQKSGDLGIFTVLNFYKCYRAYVRGKVTSFILNDPGVSEDKKTEARNTAQKYFALAHSYI